MMKKKLYKTAFSLIAGFLTLLATSSAAFADLLPEPAPVSKTGTILIIAGVVLVLAVAAVIVIVSIRKKNAK